eukprot:TRINITY_DN11376_c0_g1_i2.p1 TRINITY_DN11376_c0_g1~~TRINITY_DN11376_c0_g1_i2.p1  ORF type:complete len:293 (+),score=35.02 TRINITY_DN11376_c0_g1_i2:73-951(+)
MAMTLPRMTQGQAWWLAQVIAFGYPIYGTFQHGVAWLRTMIYWFIVLEALFISVCGGVQILCRRYGERCQNLPEDKDMWWAEFFESSRCMYMIANMAALPLLHFQLGEPTGLTWERTHSASQTALRLLVGILGSDLWLYVKHRLLHCRPLYVIHKHHHTFPNPSAMAGFAIHPLESLWTFAPIYLWDHAEHWIPMFVPSIFAFYLLNAYLHCGYTIGWVETILPRLFINTSAFHNVHHEKTNTHFGEVTSLWDYILGTAKIYDSGLQAGYQWHVDCGQGKRPWKAGDFGKRQ